MNKPSRSNKIFGDQLRQKRKAFGISQENLAFKVGLDRTYISLLERGYKSPTLNTFFHLCDALNLKPEKFIAQIHEQMLITPDLEVIESGKHPDESEK